jgi:Putative MetA-pathway of phenol degradation
MSLLQISSAAGSARILSLGVALAGFAWSAKADPGSVPLADQHAPAGVLFDHMHKAGEIMLGFRYAGSFAGGEMLHGENSARDQDVIDNGCSPHACAMKPTNMTMNMYMLDLMYAPTDWLTLMVMPMWMSHEMTMGPLKGVMPEAHDDHGGMDMGGHGEHLGSHSHGTEAWGDTIFGPEIRLAEGLGYHLHISPMISAPTGRVDFKTNDVFTHYGMQLGSGTWDFVPSITYTGRADRLTWGAQLLGIVRLEDENESGYRLGDVFQGTFWGSYRFANWISASLRGLYTEQGVIEGHYNGAHSHSSPLDLQFNYGGRFWDIGFGVNTVVPGGPLKGLRLSAEWLQPVMDDPNGYQLEREGTLWANATMSF